MKLKQNEFCHNCNQYVDFEFEDTELKQIIYCPKCGHEHYREIDGGTLLNIRASIGQTIYTAKMPELKCTLMDEGLDINCADSIKIQVEEKKVIAIKDGKAIVSGGKNMVVTNRRWGQDPKQRG
jgi:hypothetical protein